MDWQSQVFRWAARQPGGTGVVLLACGLLYAFFGFRFARFLLALACGGIGAVGGWVGARLLGLPPGAGALGLGLALLLGGLRFAQGALALVSACTLAGLGHYLLGQLGLDPLARWAAATVGGGLGLGLAWLNRREMPLVLTTLQGTALLIVGFVALSNALLPSLGVTFLRWSAERVLLVPFLFGMLCVTAYSCQTNMRQGDIRSGA